MNDFIIKESTSENVPGIQYIGRFDFTEEQGPKFSWACSTIAARFYGTSVAVKLRSFGENYFNVIIDGKVTIESFCVKDELTFKAASELEEGEHEIIIVKITESFIGTAQFLGFNFESGFILPPLVKDKRKIEFIGDSISCGFGNMVENENVEFHPSNGNAYYAFTSITARKLDYDYRIVAWAGLGLIRNFDDSPLPMPARYDWIIQENTNNKWDFSKWIPNIVVINLGTNDFSGGYIPKRDEFIKGYIDLINRVHENYSNANVVCTIGPVIDNEVLDITREYVKDGVVEYLRGNGDNLIHFLEFQHQKKESGYGVSFHPSLTTHNLMAEELSDFINRISFLRKLREN